MDRNHFFMVYYFLFITLKKIKPCFFILKTFCNTLNSWIGELANWWFHFYNVTNRLKEFQFRSSKFAIQSLKFVDLLDVLHRAFAKFNLMWKTLIYYFLFINMVRKVIRNTTHRILEDMYPLWSRMPFLAGVVGAQQLKHILNQINC